MQKVCASIPYIETNTRNLAKALAEIKVLFGQQKTKNKNPNILFVMQTVSATDKGQLGAAGSQLKGIGVKVVAEAIGDKGVSLKDEIGKFATDAEHTVAGEAGEVCSAATFNAMTATLIKGKFK